MLKGPFRSHVAFLRAGAGVLTLVCALAVAAPLAASGRLAQRGSVPSPPPPGSLIWAQSAITNISMKPGSIFRAQSAACPVIDSCFVVASVDTETGHFTSVVEHFNGRSWRRLYIGHPSDTFVSVTCATARFCLVVGTSNRDHPVIEKYSGRRWARLVLKGSRDTQVSVTCPDVKMCVLVGWGWSFSHFESWRFTNDHWHRVPSSIHLHQYVWINAVSCLTDIDCYAVGAFGAGGSGYSGFAARYNGVTWVLSKVQRSDFRGSFNNISCVRASQCVVTGDLSWNYKIDPSGLGGFLAQRISNGRWAVLGRGLPPDKQLNVDEGGVQCFGEQWCYVVAGSGRFMYLGVVAHGRLRALRVVRGVHLRGYYPYLSSLACAGPKFCIEVSTNPATPYVLVGRSLGSA